MSEQGEETMNESYLINWDGYGFEIEFEIPMAVGIKARSVGTVLL